MMSIESRFFSKIQKTKSCWLWTAATSGCGYGYFTPKHGTSVRAHRFSWEIHCGAIPKGLFICHACDVKTCVNPVHLFLGTARDNMQDAAKKGRMAVGKRHGAYTHPEKWAGRSRQVKCD